MAQAVTQQAVAPQPVAAANSPKPHPFEPEEEAAIGNAYAGAKEALRDEPEQQLAKQFNAGLNGAEDAVATGKSAAPKPRPARPAPSAPAPSPKPAASPSVAKTFVATPALPANRAGTKCVR